MLAEGLERAIVNLHERLLGQVIHHFLVLFTRNGSICGVELKFSAVSDRGRGHIVGNGAAQAWQVVLVLSTSESSVLVQN